MDPIQTQPRPLTALPCDECEAPAIVVAHGRKLCADHIEAEHADAMRHALATGTF